MLMSFRLSPVVTPGTVWPCHACVTPALTLEGESLGNTGNASYETLMMALSSCPSLFGFSKLAWTLILLSERPYLLDGKAHWTGSS